MEQVRVGEEKCLPKKSNVVVQSLISFNYSIDDLLNTFFKRGGKIDKYYLQDWNRNKRTLVYLNGWYSGKNIRAALMKALM